LNSKTDQIIQSFDSNGISLANIMKPKDFQELLDFIAKSGLAEVNIETESYKITVKRESSATYIPQMVPAAIPQIAASPTTHAAPSSAASKPKEENKPTAAEEQYLTIKSPMIGTFYRSAGPDSDAFVSVGDALSKGQTVCIIEAMKLFNEIESDISGRIVKILVENATPVEYDQPLFLVDPS
jgi:acetyl-CoA carboxylase biotin carboxyl carrier protein